MTKQNNRNNTTTTSIPAQQPNIDVYGQPILMNFDGKEGHITTACGGLMTILLVSSTIAYVSILIMFMV